MSHNRTASLTGLFVLIGLAFVVVGVVNDSVSRVRMVNSAMAQVNGVPNANTRVGTLEKAGVRYEITRVIPDPDRIAFSVKFLVNGTDEKRYEVEAAFSVTAQRIFGTADDFEGDRATTIDSFVENKVKDWVHFGTHFYESSDAETFDVANLPDLWSKDVDLKRSVLLRLYDHLVSESYYYNVRFMRNVRLEDLKVIGEYVPPFTGT